MSNSKDSNSDEDLKKLLDLLMKLHIAEAEMDEANKKLEDIDTDIKFWQMISEEYSEE
jgi:tetrahydromethanopterin S-methyltransferase subunit G